MSQHDPPSDKIKAMSAVLRDVRDVRDVASAARGASRDDEEEAFVRAMLEGESASRDAELAERALATFAPAAPARARRAAAQAAQPSPRRGPILAATASALALAAAIALLVKGRPRSSSEGAYTMTIEGADSTMRADGPAKLAARAEPIVVSEGAALTLVLTPKAPVEAPVEARVYAGCGGRLEARKVAISVAPSGAVRVEATPEQCFGPAFEGTCRVAVAVGPPHSLGDDFDKLAKDTRLSVQDFIVLHR